MSELLTDLEAAEVVDLSPKTLRKYRVEGVGPKFLKIGRKVRYRREHLESWLESRTFSNTAEAAHPPVSKSRRRSAA